MSTQQGFGIWLTGIPASGKSSIARELVKKLTAREVSVVVLESDEMRRVLTPQPTYNSEERARFYNALASIGAIITRSSINVIFDATASKQSYRDYARSLIPHFVEVLVQCPLEVCKQRDPKGIYADAATGKANTVPGMQAAYERRLNPEVTVDGQTSPEENAEVIVKQLQQMHYL